MPRAAGPRDITATGWGGTLSRPLPELVLARRSSCSARPRLGAGEASPCIGGLVASARRGRCPGPCGDGSARGPGALAGVVAGDADPGAKCATAAAMRGASRCHRFTGRLASSVLPLTSGVSARAARWLARWPRRPVPPGAKILVSADTTDTPGRPGVGLTVRPPAFRSCASERVRDPGPPAAGQVGHVWLGSRFISSWAVTSSGWLLRSARHRMSAPSMAARVTVAIGPAR